MNISFDLYYIFYYVCEFKSITKTANFLYVSQPAITNHIKNLENCLGKKLIIKTSSGIELTTDGMALYNEITGPIEKLNEVYKNFKQKSENYNQTIRIIAGHTTIKKLLLKALTQFNELHPSIKFELENCPAQESMQKLKNGNVDLIFFSLKEISDKYNNIIVKKWYSFTDIFVISAKMKSKFPDKINILELNKYPIICKAKNSVARKNIENIFSKAGIKFIPTYELSNNWIIEEYVNLNVGIGLLPKEFMKDELKNGKIIEIKTDIGLPKRETGYAYRKDSLNYRVIKEFIDILNLHINSV